MAKYNRTILKGYFQTGNIPSQAQYGDLIDSNLNLSDTGVQIVPGTLSSSILISNEITSSGNILAVGAIKGATSTFDTVDTGQGANELYAMDQEVTTTSNVIFNNITASGHIKADGPSALINLPTVEPAVTGGLWLSGSAGTNSQYLLVFNP